MSNKAFIEAVEKIDNTTFRIVGVFTDEQTFKQSFSTIIADLRSIEDVRIRLSNLLDINIIQRDLIIPIGGFDLTPPIIKDPNPPSDEEVARAVWETLSNKLERAKILSVDHPIRVDLQKQVDDLALVEYF
jgi:hypothetical protein